MRTNGAKRRLRVLTFPARCPKPECDGLAWFSVPANEASRFRADRADRILLFGRCPVCEGDVPVRAGHVPQVA